LKLDGTARIPSPRNLGLTEPNLSRQTAKGRRSRPLHLQPRTDPVIRTRRWREVDSNPRSLSLDSRGGEGAEVDQGGRERRSPVSRGDQRFESLLLHRRVGLSGALAYGELSTQGELQHSDRDGSPRRRRCRFLIVHHLRQACAHPVKMKQVSTGRNSRCRKRTFPRFG
jgi:hypothetical protein